MFWCVIWRGTIAVFSISPPAQAGLSPESGKRENERTLIRIDPNSGVPLACGGYRLSGLPAAVWNCKRDQDPARRNHDEEFIDDRAGSRHPGLCRSASGHAGPEERYGHYPDLQKARQEKPQNKKQAAA